MKAAEGWVRGGGEGCKSGGKGGEGQGKEREEGGGGEWGGNREVRGDVHHSNSQVEEGQLMGKLTSSVSLTFFFPVSVIYVCSLTFSLSLLPVFVYTLALPAPPPPPPRTPTLTPSVFFLESVFFSSLFPVSVSFSPSFPSVSLYLPTSLLSLSPSSLSVCLTITARCKEMS